MNHKIMGNINRGGIRYKSQEIIIVLVKYKGRYISCTICCHVVLQKGYYENVENYKQAAKMIQTSSNFTYFREEKVRSTESAFF